MRDNSTRMNHRARVLIVDDHVAFAEKCKAILESHFEVVGIVLDGSTLTRAVAKLKPEVVIIDMAMHPWSGFDLGEQVKAARPAAKAIYMTAASDFDDAVLAFRLGGSGYVSKLDFPDELLAAVRTAIRGDLHLSRRVMQKSARTRVPCVLTEDRSWQGSQLEAH